MSKQLHIMHHFDVAHWHPLHWPLFCHGLPAIAWKQLASASPLQSRLSTGAERRGFRDLHLHPFILFWIDEGRDVQKCKSSHFIFFFYSSRENSRRSRRENKASKVKDKNKVDKYYEKLVELAQSFWSQIDALMTSSWLSSSVGLTLGSFCFFPAL